MGNVLGDVVRRVELPEQSEQYLTKKVKRLRTVNDELRPDRVGRAVLEVPETKPRHNCYSDFQVGKALTAKRLQEQVKVVEDKLDEKEKPKPGKRGPGRGRGGQGRAGRGRGGRGRGGGSKR